MVSLMVADVPAIGNAQSVMQMCSHRRENASSVVSPNRRAADLEREIPKAVAAALKCAETLKGAIVLVEIDVVFHTATLAVVEASVGLTQRP